MYFRVPHGRVSIEPLIRGDANSKAKLVYYLGDTPDSGIPQRNQEYSVFRLSVASGAGFFENSGLR